MKGLFTTVFLTLSTKKVNQYGFRKHHSTCLAILQLTENIVSALDRKELAIGVCLDLSKAFDTVNHEILFDKLYHYVIRGIALDWVKSYFTNRKQFVQFNESYSSHLNITCGVPQGSILGPLFFLLYINDLGNISTIFKFLLFADDTNLFLSHKNPEHLLNLANSELEKVSSWFIANKLSINIKKTNFMLFKPRQKKCALNQPLLIDGKEIEQVSQTSFLGVIFNQNLSWKSHIGCNNLQNN